MSDGETKKEHVILLVTREDADASPAGMANIDLLEKMSQGNDVGQIQVLNFKEQFARQALEAIFAADTVAVWGEL